ncbi:MAG: DUF1553 domain-containing protein, partial [Planctomycetaceae bacterium]|nr:DUF1553 domain-containing protein [Planctomycetaceae bacterium]
DHDIYTVAIPVSLEKVTGFRLEALTDPSLVNKSLSRANGNFVLTNVSVTLKTDEIAQEIKIASAKADFEQNGWPVAHAIDGNPQSGWAVDGHNQAVSRAASFTFAEPVNESPDAQLVITLAHESAHAKHNIGRFRLSVTSVQDPPPGGAVDLPTDLITVLMKTDDELLPADKSSLDRFYRELAAAHEPVRQRIAQWEKEQQAVQESVRTTLITETTMPREVRILPRGNWLDDSGEVVRPAIPARLGTLNTGDRRATRLDLATWLVQPDHPLTSRVFVNRIWKLLFGNGLSRSLEDAGYQGEWPTHPELLDWMAVDFVDSGWDIKALIKQIVMSETYQQESAVSTEKRQRDPYNKWLARQSRFRLSAEMVRDNALKVSGLLVEDLGGPSVKPYQPDGYWQHLNFPARSWQHDTDDNQYRRGLYTFWCRSFLHPSLLAFDATSREECTAERPRSNTPLQALVLLNDPTYVEAARVLATKAFHSADSDSARIDWMTQRVLQRDPTSQERAILLELLRMELERYGSNPKLAQATVTNGMSPSPEHHQSEIATWTAIARTLLNLHETVTRE